MPWLEQDVSICVLSGGCVRRRHLARYPFQNDLDVQQVENGACEDPWMVQRCLCDDARAGMRSLQEVCPALQREGFEHVA
jgi:hypothetical protein